jgi:DNA repair exonuclease SbcCD ATPase subunit
LNIRQTWSGESFRDSKERIESLQKTLNKLEGRLDFLEKKESSLEKELSEMREDQEVLSLTAELFKKFLDEEISEDIKSIVELQTEGLQEIFYDKDMSATADISESRGKVSVSIQAVSKTNALGEIRGDPTTSFGGSIATIQGILLRISVLYRRGFRPVLILDETLKFVNKQYIDRAVSFLQRLCETMGLDILLITHDHDIVSAAKTAYRINYNDGTATFQKIK